VIEIVGIGGCEQTYVRPADIRKYRPRVGCSLTATLQGDTGDPQPFSSARDALLHCSKMRRK